MAESIGIYGLIESVQAAFEAKDYAKKYKEELARIFQKLKQYCFETGQEHWSAETMKGFEAHYYQTHKATKHSVVERALNAIEDFSQYGKLLRRTKPSLPKWEGVCSGLFAGYFEQYKSAGWSTSAVTKTQYVLMRFQSYMDRHGLSEIEQIDTSDLYGYIEEAHIDNRKKHKARVLRDLRYFLEYCHTLGHAAKVFEHTYPSIRVFEGSGGIPNVFTKDEVGRLLSAVDRASPGGKRDYAILLLATRYGLRAVDIKNLCFENIDWQNKRIQLIQSKTQRELTLPLLEDVGWAIIDYLEHARPAAVQRNLFVTHKAPHEPFVGSMNHLIQQYMRLAKIPIQSGRAPGFHALRHALVSELLRNNVPITAIAPIVGHASIETTAKYQRSDLSQLASCALEVPYVQE